MAIISASAQADEPRRCDPVATYNSFAAPSRSEFETTQEFEARRTSAAPPASEVCAFPVLNSEAVYDADRETFYVNPARRPFSIGFTSPAYEALPQSYVIHRRDYPDETYEGGNALGGKVTVVSTVVDEWIVAEPGKRNTARAPVTPLPLPLPSSRADAPRLKPRLGVLVVARVPANAQPAAMTLDLVESDVRAHNGYAYTKPTFPSPYRRVVRSYVIIAEVLGYWVYDTMSGEVLRKYDRRGDPLDGAPTP